MASIQEKMTLPLIREPRTSFIDVKGIVYSLSQSHGYSVLQSQATVHHAIADLLDYIENMNFPLEEWKDERWINSVLLTKKFQGLTQEGILIRYTAFTDYLERDQKDAYFKEMCVNLNSNITPLYPLAVELSDVVVDAFFRTTKQKQIAPK